MIQTDNCVKYFNKLILDKLVERIYKRNAEPLEVPINCWIAGGALKSYFLGEPFVDVDLFVSNQEDFYTVYDILLNLDGAYRVFENDNVIKIKYKNKVFDLVKKFFKDPQDTINNFDFTVTCCAVDRNQIYHHPSFFIDLSKKQLMINNLPYPISTMWRMQKYMLKGYRMCKQEMTKVVNAIVEHGYNTMTDDSVSHIPKVEDITDIESDSSMFNGID